MVDLKDARADSRVSVGVQGETLVALRLEAMGYRILGRNVRVGRLEIDLVARKGDLVVFCEVRTRSHDRLMDPIATLDRRKAQRIRRAAAIWLGQERVSASQLRFDAASVVLDEREPRVTYYEHAF